MAELDRAELLWFVTMQIASWELDQDAADKARGVTRSINKKALAARQAREAAAAKQKHRG